MVSDLIKSNENENEKGPASHEARGGAGEPAEYYRWRGPQGTQIQRLPPSPVLARGLEREAREQRGDAPRAGFTC